jgi:hypothetical protein
MTPVIDTISVTVSRILQRVVRYFNPLIRLVLASKAQVVTAQLISEPRALSETLGRMLAANPATALFTGIRQGPDGHPIAESLDRERRRGFVVVRLHINGEEPTVPAN